MEKLIFQEKTWNGSIKEMELKPGKYTFKEVLAPKGYAIKTSSLQFSVAADGVINTQEQEIRDELATYGLRKVDQQGKLCKGPSLACTVAKN